MPNKRLHLVSVTVYLHESDATYDFLRQPISFNVICSSQRQPLRRCDEQITLKEIGCRKKSYVALLSCKYTVIPNCVFT